MTAARTTATLAAVAQAAGVSLSTASRVLNKRLRWERISSATREHVQAAADRLGYQPHRPAQALVLRSSGVVGVCVNAPADLAEAGHALAGIGYAGEVLGHLEVRLRRRGLDLLLVAGGGGQDAARRCLERWRGRQLDGAILIQGASPAAERELAAAGMPAVVLDGASAALDAVALDQAAAMAAVVDHLADLGHRRLAVLGSCQAQPWADLDERVEGFRAACVRRDLPPPLVLHGVGAERLPAGPDYQCHEGRWAVDRLRAEADPPTALATISDVQAFAAAQRLAELGMRCPDDLSLVGFDDGFLARWGRPPLSSVGHDLAALAEAACGLLERRLAAAEAGGYPAEQRRIVPSLVVRGSTIELRSRP